MIEDMGVGGVRWEWGALWVWLVWVSLGVAMVLKVLLRSLEQVAHLQLVPVDGLPRVDQIGRLRAEVLGLFACADFGGHRSC